MPRSAKLQARAETGHFGGARNGRTEFERLPGALEADQAQVVQRRDTRVLDEQPQQVALRRIPHRRE